MKKYMFWLVTLMLTAMLTPAYGAGVEIGLGGWNQTPSGMLSYKGTSTDDDIDIKDDLKYDSESRVMGRLKVDMPLLLPNIYVVVAPTEFEGEGDKTVEFTFGDVDFSAGQEFKSKITFNQYDVAFYYGIPAIKVATADTLNIDLGLNVRYVDFSAEITGQPTGTTTTLTEEESLSVVVPMIYAAAQITPTDRFAIEAEARGISISGNSLYSFIGRLRIKLGGPAFIAGGYRYDSLDIDEDDVKVEARISGPFIEIGLKF